ncbi:DDE superfamily endonuclease domain [Trinorchestia longiramus]|nr:DDE superfamily endonuclease domain [Trinorchestia longiramus]
MDIDVQLQIFYSLKSGQPPDSVMQQFNIDLPTYYQFEADKRKIEKYVHKLADGHAGNPSKKLKVSSSVDDKLEITTFKWFLEMKAKGISVQDLDIEKTTVAISNHLMREEGTGTSDDWLTRLYNNPPTGEYGQNQQILYEDQSRKSYQKPENSEVYSERPETSYTNQNHVYPERNNAYQETKSFEDQRDGFVQPAESYSTELQENYPDPDQSEVYPDQSEDFAGQNFSVSDTDCFPSKIKTLMFEQKLSEHQLYHADETGLHWKAMPDNSLEIKNLSTSEIGRQKMTALLCANADGSHKLKSLIVGNLKHRRALRNACDILPVCYKSSTSAFMTCTVFAEWFHNSFVPGVKNFQENVLHVDPKDVKAVLLLDNAPCHPDAGYLRSHDGRVRTFVMPATTSSNYRPMDQGIIASCKRLYRKYQLDDCLVFSKPSACSNYGIDASANVRNYTIKDAIHNWALAWKEVTASALQNAWAKLLQKPEAQNPPDDLNPSVYHRLLHAAGDTDVSLQNVEDWLKIDEMELGYDEKTVMGIAPVVSWDAGQDDALEDDPIPTKEPTLGLPEAKIVMDQVIRVIENPQFPKMHRYYGLAKEMRSTLTDTLLNRPGPSSAFDLDTTHMRDGTPSFVNYKPKNSHAHASKFTLVCTVFNAREFHCSKNSFVQD